MAGPRLSISKGRLVASAAMLGAVVFPVAPSFLDAARSPSAAAPTKSPPISRTDLQRHDLSIPGREAIQVRVDFNPGAAFPRHSHPGEEIVYVLRGTLEYRLDGKPPVTLKAGGVLFIPAGVIHGAANVGSDRASELATYVVEKGKPLVTLAK